jgi:hypothetical protein
MTGIKNLKHSDEYRRFQDLMFQQIQEQEALADQTVTEKVEHFVDLAASKGFTLDRLIEMAESGMSGAMILRAVKS